MKELEDRWSDLGQFIREQRQLGRMSLRKLSEVAGISNPYLSQIERGLRKPSAEILQQIAKALRISAETLYVRAGLLDGEPEASSASAPASTAGSPTSRPASGVLAAIRDDPALTRRQKQILQDIYESFRTAEPPTEPEAADPTDPRGD